MSHMTAGPLGPYEPYDWLLTRMPFLTHTPLLARMLCMPLLTRAWPTTAATLSHAHNTHAPLAATATHAPHDSYAMFLMAQTPCC